MPHGACARILMTGSTDEGRLDGPAIPAGDSSDHPMDVGRGLSPGVLEANPVAIDVDPGGRLPGIQPLAAVLR